LLFGGSDRSCLFPLPQLHHLVEKMEDELTPEGKAIMELLVAAGADLDINNNMVRFVDSQSAARISNL